MNEEQLARQLHEWYLEATAALQPESFNPNAQKSYDDLSEEQKEIDRYIARKILEAEPVEEPVEGMCPVCGMEHPSWQGCPMPKPTAAEKEAAVEELKELVRQNQKLMEGKIEKLQIGKTYSVKTNVGEVTVLDGETGINMGYALNEVISVVNQLQEEVRALKGNS